MPSGDRDVEPAAVPMLPAGAAAANGGSATDEMGRSPCAGLGLFERASSRWWNPQFASPLLESQYWKCSFPQLRDRFRSGLVYVALSSLCWLVYYAIFEHWTRALPFVFGCVAIILVTLAILGFTFSPRNYQRFYLPTSFLCLFLVCVVTLLVFSLQSHPVLSPIGSFATAVEVLLLLYTVIPLPLYLCISVGLLYSILFEILTLPTEPDAMPTGIKLVLHLCIHILGIHIYILSQVRQRKTFLRVGQSLIARKELEIETQFKDRMIESVMPRFVADQLLKETSEMRRMSATADSSHSTGGGPGKHKTHIGSGAPVFRPFTMNLMEYVSILFADIAGFTKMSSNKSADELVNLLNDLFGRFDRICVQVGCEKISTLGDCYYCVSGCPEPRPDHAQCCVEMGLAMCVAIKQFDIDRGQDVNMRVGIHTGKVMCGLVGSKRFKFDVFSNDVTLANTMESTGMAGRVHISQSTASFLKDDYILDDGDKYEGMKTYFIVGRTKELSAPPTEAGAVPEIDSAEHKFKQRGSFKKKLVGRVKSLQTASQSLTGRPIVGGSLRMKLLSSQTKPSVSHQNMMHETDSEGQDGTKKSASLNALSSSLPQGSDSVASARTDPVTSSYTPTKVMDKNKDIANGGSSGGTASVKGSLIGSRSSGLPETGMGSDHSAQLDTVVMSHHAASLTRFDADNMTDFDRRLADVIQGSDLARGGYFIHRGSLNPWTLQFRDLSIENEYRNHFAAVKKQSQPTNNHDHQQQSKVKNASDSYGYSGVFIDMLVASVIFIIVSIVAFIVFGASAIAWPIYFIFGFLIVLLTVLLIGIPMLKRSPMVTCFSRWVPRHLLGLLLISLPAGAAFCNVGAADAKQGLSGVTALQLVVGYIAFVMLFAHCNFSQLGCWPKTFTGCVYGLALIILCQVCVAPPYCLPLNATALSLVNVSDYQMPFFSGNPVYRWEVILDVFLSLVLIGFLNYQFEVGFRMTFFGDLQARQDTEQMQSMRDQADWLLTNIIPHFVTEELKINNKYSENHNKVAVLFASIVNWSEMYEETFEGGREFLRVLNEVIGDFDELLDRSEFSQVEKIKTIGSTYMVAAGLNPERRRLCVHPYEHLYQLMEFALALQEALDNFNQDLLNFDFVMKLGYNIGPITAGVIGTTKLYYDIWGDTVNISSRMYSTGVLGRVQVSQQVKELLCDRYDFEFRDHIEVKGIDTGMDVYLVKGRKGETSDPL